jgi:L-lactate dehydrogenase complex protein LldG
MNPLLEKFKVRAEAVSAEVHHLPTRSAALQFILGLLIVEKVADAPQQYVVWSDTGFLSGFDKRQLISDVPGLRFEVTRESAAMAKIGISQVDWAISDTGTLVMNAVAVEERLVSALPAIHIALVPSNGLRPDMASVFRAIHPSECGYISMITGPSRTADIERVLTIGVHGPGRLIVIFVDELGESNVRRISTIN